MEPLTKNLIQVPSLWRLSMQIDDEAVQVVINSIAEDNSLIYKKIPLNKALPMLTALEDLVYENPLLLADFNKVDILIDTKRFTVVPSSIKSDEEREEIMGAIWPEGQYEIVPNDLPGCDSTLLMGIDTPLLAFLRRTFIDVPLRHPVSVLAAYFAPRSQQGNCGKIYANIRDKAVDVVAFSSRTPWSIPSERNTLAMRRSFLRIANTYEATSAADISYYILAAAQTTGFSLKGDEIILCGNKEMRQQLLPTMRQFASVVMPVLSPAEMLRAGDNAFKAPFQLVILPLL